MSEDDLSYGERLAADSNITIYCSPCNRQVDFDPTNLIESKRPLGARFRCTICGERGLCIASPKWRYNALDEKIPYGTPPKLPHGFYGSGLIIGPPQEPARKRRRWRR